MFRDDAVKCADNLGRRPKMVSVPPAPRVVDAVAASLRPWLTDANAFEENLARDKSPLNRWIPRLFFSC